MLFLYLFDRFLTRVCRAVGHCDEVHDTGLVRARFCRYCRSFRIENYTKGNYDVWYGGPCDINGTPTEMPHTIIVREVPPVTVTEESPP